MKNREKLLNTNIYDFLMQINAKLDRFGSRLCVLDLLRINPVADAECIANCEKCIAQWLNKEADK
jgi:hypothetical protein